MYPYKKKKIEIRHTGGGKVIGSDKQRWEFCVHKPRNAGRGKELVLPRVSKDIVALLTPCLQLSETDFELLASRT